MNLTVSRRHIVLLFSIVFLFLPSLVVGQILPGSATLYRYQQQQFKFSGSGANVTWWIEPTWMGAVTPTGIYTAPSMGGTALVFAQAPGGPVYTASIFLNGKAAPVSSTPSLTPTPLPTSVSVVVSPSSTSLQAGQAAQFSASVTGTPNEQVQWSLSPNVGTITNGYYVAPASFANETQVTISAKSVAVPGVSGSATVLLTQPVAPVQPVTPTLPVTVQLFPTSLTLQPGQSANFTAMVGGSMNTAVTWSISPNVGTVVNGTYTAPSNLTTQQTVQLTATSAASPSISASSALTLKPVAAPPTPTVSISLSPTSASLSAGQSATFTPTVSGSSNTAVTWSFNPQVGTLVNGKYTAPATISSSQTVTITATSAASSSKTATASVTLNPPPPTTSAPSTTSTNQNGSTTPTSITLPIEVMGPNGTTAAVSFNVPSGASLSGALNLYMQIHGLKYNSEASVQVNKSAWFPLSTGSVTLLGNATAFGGIGGGFHTLELTVNLPGGTVVAGTNTITFRFNGTDGVVSGYRVLAFNIQSAGSNLLPSSLFVQDDPSTWQAPSTAASDIAAGQSLWQSAALTTPSGPIKAHCSDCHAVDGRDLKYFNYSNNSIEVRSVFHGLTAQQGAQIASYIRSLNLPNPGRPWNPPYQPGPGLDSQPVSDWAAGAGLDAVLDNDSEELQYLAPGGSTSGWAANAYLSARDLPIIMQLPDWNSWLPVVHPMDAYGSRFTTSSYNLALAPLRNTLQPNSTTAYKYALQIGLFDTWFESESSFLIPIISTANFSTPNLGIKIYSAALWQQVKMWELNQEFGLEGMPQVPFGAKANLRGWYGNTAFDTSPNMLKIPAGAGIGNGSQVVRDYFAMAWYQVQLILNDGQGKQSGHSPIDYGYVYGFVKDVLVVDSSVPGSNLLLEWSIKALQEFTLSGIGPQAGAGAESAGWDPIVTTPVELVYGAWLPLWSATSPATQATLLQAYTQAWFAQAQQYTAQQYYQGGWATAAQNPATINSLETFGGQVWYALPRLRLLGVDPSLTTQIGTWAAGVWPSGNWTLNNTATCSSAAHCTSDSN